MHSPLRGNASRPVCRRMGVSGAVTLGVPDHPTFGDASTPRGPRSTSQPVCRWMSVPMIGPRVSSALTPGVPDHPTPGDALTRPANQTKSTPTPSPVPTRPTVGKGKFPGLSVSRAAAPPAQYTPWPRCSHVTRRDCQRHFYTRKRSQTDGTGNTGTFRRNSRHVFLVGE